MDTNYLENNNLTLVGKVTSEKRFSHEIYGESFYSFDLQIPRLSGSEDIIPVTVSERLINDDMMQMTLYKQNFVGRKCNGFFFHSFYGDLFIPLRIFSHAAF